MVRKATKKVAHRVVKPKESKRGNLVSRIATKAMKVKQENIVKHLTKRVESLERSLVKKAKSTKPRKLSAYQKYTSKMLKQGKTFSDISKAWGEKNKSSETPKKKEEA
jgi:SOS response regulatory protein OraA/RecX